jgi:hypothetical protein
MEHYQKTGRALQLEGLENARNKVTLGFKCDAGTKIQLAKEAFQHGLTLSEYVDTVITTRHQKNQSSVSESTSKLVFQADRDRQQIKNLEKKVAFYENDLMKRALNLYQGQKLNYNALDGTVKSITINSVEDVFTILIHSVKLINHV